ncbi:intradiol ring-cleavage dioxygenase [Flavobacterium sp.]|uniref:dioxygenase family protein n=1 Tax=Flavobacterium sp. TaxID=239 RepID=UPI0028BD9F35|nr:intradiol ring-cleavage dioxygenase [Flavobacterium sp.]
MTSSIKIICLSVFLSTCQQKETPSAITENTLNPEVENNDCDNPDAEINCCFASMPTNLTSLMTIPNSDGNSERLIIEGTIYRNDEKTPYSDVILYAYHTDSKGEYSKNGKETGVQKWHGSHHGWCKTDKNGNYRIETIRPASYPNSTAPAHIHAAIKLPDNNTPFYITDFLFKDDPNLPKNQQNRFSYQGGSGIVDVTKKDKVWYGNRNLVLK